MCAPQDEALGEAPPGIKHHCSLPHPNHLLRCHWCLSQCGVAEGRMATLPRSGAVIPACLRSFPGGPVDLTVSHTGVAAAGPEQEVGEAHGWAWKLTGEQSICCCLPCWSLELESWQKAPEMQVETGQAEGLCLSVLTAPQPQSSAPPCPLSQAGALLPAATPRAPLPTPPPPGPCRSLTAPGTQAWCRLPPAWLASGFPTMSLTRLECRATVTRPKCSTESPLGGT